MASVSSAVAERKRRTELRELARVVALAMASSEYVPTLRDPALADAFDAAMVDVGDRRRAWRGSAQAASR